MNDLRKTDIEDIERHWHNYRLFVWFIKLEKKYVFFKRLMFLDKGISPFYLFTLINNTNLDRIIINNTLPNKIDQLWGSIFTYVPFSFSWTEKDVDWRYMKNLSRKWNSFLVEHNYDIFKF